MDFFFFTCSGCEWMCRREFRLRKKRKEGKEREDMSGWDRQDGSGGKKEERK